MKKKRLAAAMLAGLLVLSLAGCGGSSGGNDSAQGGDAQNEPYEVSMILKTTGAEFWQIMKTGAEAYQK